MPGPSKSIQTNHKRKSDSRYVSTYLEHFETYCQVLLSVITSPLDITRLPVQQFRGTFTVLGGTFTVFSGSFTVLRGTFTVLSGTFTVLSGIIYIPTDSRNMGVYELCL